MAMTDYIWFWKTSWSYMGGNSFKFWMNVIPATYRYRAEIIKDQRIQND